MVSFSRSVWKKLHRAEKIYTASARGARDNYEVCASPPFEASESDAKLVGSIKLPSPASFFLQRIFWKLKCVVLKIVLAHAKIDAFPDRVQAKSILTATVHIQTHVFV